VLGSAPSELRCKMPSESAKQQRSMAMALSIKRGKTPKKKARSAVRRMLSMSDQQLSDFTEGSR